MKRVFNFNAGPSALPEAVLIQARDELLDWHSTGMSVMEMSHRGKSFVAIAAEAEADLRELMQIPTNYKVLFMQGGARSQFSMVPMNLLGNKKTADYLHNGIWSKAAVAEAKRYCEVNEVANTAAEGYKTIPPINTWKLNPEAAYLHITSNETVNGVEFPNDPMINDVPLVADMSSNILSRPMDISKYALIYAGAQKNIGPAGLTVVIIREDLLGSPLPFTPTMFNYKVQAENDSMYNTPPTYAWYIAGLVFKWIKQQGGLAVMAERNQRKAKALYDFIDRTPFYKNPIDPTYRSKMNVVFTLADEALNEQFLQEANKANLTGLKGHKLVGGMRASIYNAVPEQAVMALIDFMGDFARRYG